MKSVRRTEWYTASAVEKDSAHRSRVERPVRTILIPTWSSWLSCGHGRKNSNIMNRNGSPSADIKLGIRTDSMQRLHGSTVLGEMEVCYAHFKTNPESRV